MTVVNLLLVGTVLLLLTVGSMQQRLKRLGRRVAALEATLNRGKRRSRSRWGAES